MVILAIDEMNEKMKNDVIDSLKSWSPLVILVFLVSVSSGHVLLRLFPLLLLFLPVSRSQSFSRVSVYSPLFHQLC